MTDSLPRRVRIALAEAGLDISRLAHESPAHVERQVQDRLERAASVVHALRQRLISGRLSANQRAEAKHRLQRAADELGRFKQLMKLLAGRRPRAAFPEPTVERVRHAAGDVLAERTDADGAPLRAPRHRVSWPVDRVGPTVPAEDYNAAQRLREVFEMRRAKVATSDWSGSGGRSPGARSLASDVQLAAAEEFDTIFYGRPGFPGLSRPVQTIVANFVLEVAPPGRDAPMTLQEFGRHYGNTRDDRGGRVGGIVAIKIACAEIAKQYRAYDDGRRRARESRGLADSDRVIIRSRRRP
jgi:hypothetical protein